jgi:hypothetical protein
MSDNIPTPYVPYTDIAIGRISEPDPTHTTIDYGTVQQGSTHQYGGFLA